MVSSQIDNMFMKAETGAMEQRKTRLLAWDVFKPVTIPLRREGITSGTHVIIIAGVWQHRGKLIPSIIRRILIRIWERALTGMLDLAP